MMTSLEKSGTDLVIYDETRFWQKLVGYAKNAGKEVVEKALWLYYAAQRPETPAWAKAIAYSAIGYFILPMDTIPDVAPLVGYSDDLGALTLAIATIASYVNAEVKENARIKIKDWFG